MSELDALQLKNKRLSAKLRRLSKWLRQYPNYHLCPCCGRSLVTWWCKSNCELGIFTGTTKPKPESESLDD